MSSPSEWYESLPPVVRAWGTAGVLGATLAALNLLSPGHLYFDYHLLGKLQVWRPLTCFLFLGGFSMPFAMQLLLLARHGVQLEANTFQGRTADFVYMLLVGMGAMLVVDVILTAITGAGFQFLGGALVFMLLYVWSREYASAQVNIMGIVTLQAFYLPWAYLALDVVFGASIQKDLLGIAAGHLYFFLTTIYPRLPSSGGRQLLQTPLWVYWLVDKWGIAGAPQVRPQQQQPAVSLRTASAAGGRAAPASPAPATASAEHSAFRGRSYRLNRD